MELNLARDVKNKSNEKGFCRCISRKRKTRENVSLMMNNGTGSLVTGNVEKAEVLNIFFTSVFIGKANRNSRPVGPVGRSGALKTDPQKRRIREPEEAGHIQVRGS